MLCQAVKIAKLCAMRECSVLKSANCLRGEAGEKQLTTFAPGVSQWFWKPDWGWVVGGPVPGGVELRLPRSRDLRRLGRRRQKGEPPLCFSGDVARKVGVLCNKVRCCDHVGRLAGRKIQTGSFREGIVGSHVVSCQTGQFAAQKESTHDARRRWPGMFLRGHTGPDDRRCTWDRTNPDRKSNEDCRLGDTTAPFLQHLQSMIRIRFHGRGGHGMKTASRMVGTAAFLAGFQGAGFSGLWSGASGRSCCRVYQNR